MVTAATRGCTYHEPMPDCLDCGACCREAFDSVPVDDDDVARGRPPEGWVRVHDDGWRDVRRVPSPSWEGRTRCAALTGDGIREPFGCVIYAERPRACRELLAGSTNCLFARRRVGLARPRSEATKDGGQPSAPPGATGSGGSAGAVSGSGSDLGEGSGSATGSDPAKG